MLASDEMRKCFRPYQWFVDHAGNDGCTGDHLMWVYRPSEDGGGFLVGYFYPDRTWYTESTYHGDGAKDRAAARVRWLNGGNG